MKSFRFFKKVALLVTVIVTCASSAFADDLKLVVADRREAVVLSFLKHLEKLDSERGEQAKRAVSDHADSAVDALTEGLIALYPDCLLYTSPSPRDKRQSRMPSSA